MLLPSHHSLLKQTQTADTISVPDCSRQAFPSTAPLWLELAKHAGYSSCYMKICMDIQSAVAQRAGIGRYTRLLAQNLAPQLNPGEEIELFYFNFKGGARPFEASGSHFKSVEWCPGRAAQLAWKTAGWPPFDFFAGPADIYHFPNFILPPLKKGKSVVTVHDMSFLRLPAFAEERNLRFLMSRIQATTKKADAILTVCIRPLKPKKMSRSGTSPKPTRP